MSGTVTEFDEPQDDWLTAAIARSAFAPNYLATSAARHRALRSEAAEFFSERGIKANFDSWGVDLNVNFMGVSFSIEADCVSLVDFDPEEECEGSEFVDAKLHVSEDNLDNFLTALVAKQVYGQFAKPAATVAALALRLKRMFEYGFAEALRSNEVFIWARPKSPLNAFRRIHPDQFRHFRIVDVEAGTAKGPAGERLWSLHIQPNRSLALPPTSPGSEIVAPSRAMGAGISKSVDACTEWVLAQIRSSPDKPTFTVDELREEARNRWGDELSERKFLTAVRLAKHVANAPAWSKPGPRKRHPKSVRRIK